MDTSEVEQRFRDFEHVIATMNCGLVSENHDGILTFANERMLKWLGYAYDEIVGRPINDLIPAELHEFVEEDLRLAEQGDMRARLLVARRKDSTTFPILSIPQRFMDADGNPDGYFAIVVDLGTVLTARRMGPSEPVDIRSTLQRISMELQSISIAAETGAGGGLPIGCPELEELSPREREVLAHLLTGERVTVIANELHISQHTVRNHLKSMYRKLGVSSQAELIQLVRSFSEEPPEANDAP